ncbi:MAG: glycosyltransferase family 4 protein, partial [Thermodesulfobacteriota bacterium]
VAVFPTDSDKKPDFPGEIPDIYIFHGHPYDYRSAPGRFNVFILAYEYFRVKKEDEALIGRLNNYFDLVLVPTRFVEDTLSGNGLNVPIKLLPWGIDRKTFNPSAKPKKIPGLKGFNFVYAGAFYERKGVDALVNAYLEEFSPGEDVSLIIKEAMRCEHLEPWVLKVMEQYDSPIHPKIIHINREDKDMAGYFTAADVGVFPFRGEGFGLPVLECIASGRPVIATEGTGPMDFCSSENARFIKAKKKLTKNHLHLEPDIKHLRVLMREAFENGKLTDKERAFVSGSVNKFTWERTVGTLNSIIKQIPRRPSISTNLPDNRNINSSPAVAYSYFQRGLTSWKKYSLKIDALLKKNFENYSPVCFKDSFTLDSVDIIIGQSEYALENFLKASDLNPGVLKVLHQEGTVLEE